MAVYPYPYHPRPGRTPRKCAGCHRTFWLPPSLLKRWKSSYCRKRCWPRFKRRCERCAKVFYVGPAVNRRGFGRYCSHQCRLLPRIPCPVCQRKFVPFRRSNQKSPRKRFCSWLCSQKWMVPRWPTGKRNHAWKGGRWINKRGYIVLRAPHTKGGVIFEHRAIM